MSGHVPFQVPGRFHSGWKPSAPGTTVSSGPGLGRRLSDAATSAVNGVRTSISSPLRSLADKIAPKVPSDSYTSLGSGGSGSGVTSASSLPGTSNYSWPTGTASSLSGASSNPGTTSTVSTPLTTSSAAPTTATRPTTATGPPTTTIVSQVGPPPTDDDFQTGVRCTLDNAGNSEIYLDFRRLQTELDKGEPLNIENMGAASGRNHRLKIWKEGRITRVAGDGAIDAMTTGSIPAGTTASAGTTAPAGTVEGTTSATSAGTADPAVTTDPSGLQGAPTIEEYASVAPPMFRNPFPPDAPPLSLSEEDTEYLAPGVKWSNWSIDRTDDLSALGGPKRLLDDKTAWIQKRYKDATTGDTILSRDEARQLALTVFGPETEDPKGLTISTVGLDKVVCDQLLPKRGVAAVLVDTEEMPTATTGSHTASTMTCYGDELSDYIEKSVGPPRGFCGYDYSQVTAAKTLIDDIASLGDQMAERHGLSPDETNHFSTQIGSLLGSMMINKPGGPRRELSAEEIGYADAKFASAISAFRSLSAEAQAELYRRGSISNSRSATAASSVTASTTPTDTTTTPTDATTASSTGVTAATVPVNLVPGSNMLPQQPPPQSQYVESTVGGPQGRPYI
ncbi:hypothetical protein IAT40_007006 [Kwoniella sp. CBS 6097]